MRQRVRRVIAVGAVTFAGAAALHSGAAHGTGLRAEEPTVIARLPIKALATVYSRVTDRIYVSVDRSDPTYGNRVITLNPSTGAVAATLTTGGDPGAILIARDGSALHIKMGGGNSIQSFDLRGDYSPYTTTLSGVSVSDMTAQTGNGHVFAVADSTGRVLVIDRGTILPTTTTAVEGVITQIAFGGTTDRLYGLSGGNDIRLFRTDAKGIRLEATRSNAVDVTQNNIGVRGHLLFMSAGQVYDPEADVVLGKFPGSQSVAIAADQDADVAYGAWGGAIHIWDTRTFRPVGSVRVPGLADRPKAYSRWRAHGLVVATQSEVVILEHDLIGTTPGDTVATSTPPPEGVSLYFPLVRHDQERPYIDDFSDPASGWPVEHTSTHTLEYSGGEYRVVNRTVDQAVVIYSDVRRKNLDVAVTARTAGEELGFYGLVFGAEMVALNPPAPSSQYLFLVQPDLGEWQLLLCEDTCSRLDGGRSDAIRPGGGKNRLRVTWLGGWLRLYVGGTEVWKRDHVSYESGWFHALVAGALDAGHEARFDDYVVQEAWQPGNVLAAPDVARANGRAGLSWLGGGALDVTLDGELWSRTPGPAGTDR